MSGKPVPKDGFVTTLVRVTRDGVTRWRSHDGRRLYEWDTVHGHFEVYNKRGRHVGVVNVEGMWTGDAVPGRSINV